MRETIEQGVGSKVTKNWQDGKPPLRLSLQQLVAGEQNCSVATLLCSVHAPGISQLADRPHVPCGEAIPENGRAFRALDEGSARGVRVGRRGVKIEGFAEGGKEK